MITTIAIPADDNQPLRQEQIDPQSLDDFRRLVGGHLETIPLKRPGSTMYVNEEGKLNRLPMNLRATALLWAHNSIFRGTDTVAGDAFVTGPTDEQGDATSVPDELLKLLFTTKRFRVLTKVFGDDQYYGNLRVFNAWFDAYFYGVDLAQRWTQVDEIQVVSVDE